MQASSLAPSYDPTDVAKLALVVPAESYRSDDFLRATDDHTLTVITDAREPLAVHAVIESSLSLDPSEFDRIARALASRGVEAVVGVDELSVRFAAHVSDLLGLTSGRATVVERATRKDLFRAHLDRGEFPQPRWVLAESVAKLTGPWLERHLGPGPWVLKPRDRTASEGVVRVERETLDWGRSQLERVVGPSSPVLAEQYVSGPELALEGIMTGGALEVVEVFDKPGLGDGPTFWEELYVAPSELPAAQREEVRLLVERAANWLGLTTSPLHAELRITSTGPALLEVAPRTIGGRCSRAIRLTGGRRLEELVIARTLGELEGPRVTRRGGPLGIWMVPTPSDGTFEGFDNVDQAWALPGVEAIEVTTTPGTAVYAPPRSNRYLGFVFVHGPSRREVLSRLDAVQGRRLAGMGQALSDSAPILLVTTYDLGHRSQLAAMIAGRLRHRTHVVDADCAATALHEAIGRASAVVISVPMLTGALRARTLIEQHRELLRTRLVLLVGTYASTLREALDGESWPLLWAIDRDDPDEVAALLVGERSSRRGGRRHYEPPPSQDDTRRYRTLERGGTVYRTGYVETTLGCRHRCLHCPVAGAWHGRIVTLETAAVLTDIEEQVARGAAHISFGDADFLSAPRHAVAILEEAHRRYPSVTFDVTIKIAELARDPSLAARLAAAGVVFVISAVESLRDDILERLGKGHTRADVIRVRDALFDAGVGLHPTFIPFTPWSTLEDVHDILRFVWDSHLEDVVEPVQYGIELLAPRTTLLRLDESFGSYDTSSMSYAWRYSDPRLEGLAAALRSAAARAPSFRDGFDAAWQLVGAPPRPPRPASRAPAPARLSEAWFCCAAPTS